MRQSGQNTPRGSFQGQRPRNQSNVRGKRRHRNAEGERQDRRAQGNRNRRINAQVGLSHQENRSPRRRNRQNLQQRPIRDRYVHRNRMRQGFDRGWLFRQRRRNGFKPAAGFTGYDDRIEIDVELTGVEEKDINVAVAGKMLLVKGKKHRKESEEKHNIRRSELKYGRFHRAFPLPRMAKTEGITAEFKDGILTIAIPKKEAAKATEIPINVEG